MWILESGIEKLLSVPQLKADGFTIYYNTKRNWVYTITEDEKILFKKETGECKGLNFIEMGSQ